MNSIIITIGDELLIGQVINTNAAFIAENLNSIGIEVGRMLTVADDETEILHSFQESYEKFDVIVVTGGLGPTHDDITKKVVCKFFGIDLITNQEVLDNIKRLMQHRDGAVGDDRYSQVKPAIAVKVAHREGPPAAA